MLTDVAALSAAVPARKRFLHAAIAAVAPMAASAGVHQRDPARSTIAHSTRRTWKPPS